MTSLKFKLQNYWSSWYFTFMMYKSNWKLISIIIIWLAPPAGKMNQILRCDWLPERARWSHLARSGLPALSHKKIPQKPYNKSFIDQACSVKMAWYWPRSFFACLWTKTESRSINTQKKNSANIQPSWPHTWSINNPYLYLSVSTRTVIGQFRPYSTVRPAKIWSCVWCQNVSWFIAKRS